MRYKTDIKTSQHIILNDDNDQSYPFTRAIHSLTTSKSNFQIFKIVENQNPENHDIFEQNNHIENKDL